MKSIPFFKDTIAIEITSCSGSFNIGTVCTIKDFADDEPVALYELDNGDLHVVAGRYPNTRFIEGPETLSKEEKIDLAHIDNLARDELVNILNSTLADMEGAQHAFETDNMNVHSWNRHNETTNALRKFILAHDLTALSKENW